MMSARLKPYWILFLFFITVGANGQKGMEEKSDSLKTTILTRIAEIEVFTEYIEEYIEILKEESEASVRLEPGVICIFPMQEAENPNQIKILEIYADSTAYKSHLETPHFKKYKTGTLHMVKSLKLIDMRTIDGDNMSKLFLKMNILE